MSATTNRGTIAAPKETDASFTALAVARSFLGNYTAMALNAAADLHDMAFVALHPDTNVGRSVQAMFETHGVKTRTVAVANIAPALVECVVAGLGVSLVHPLSVSGREHHVVVRRFEPEIGYTFQLCRIADTRNARLVDAFAEALRRTAEQLSNALWSAN